MLDFWDLAVPRYPPDFFSSGFLALELVDCLADPKKLKLLIAELFEPVSATVLGLG